VWICPRVRGQVARALLIGDRSLRWVPATGPPLTYTQIIIHTIYVYKFLFLKHIHTTSTYNFEL
jgi:hypothetical protein